MKELKNVLVSLILTLSMSLGLAPSMAFAQDEDGPDKIEEEYIDQYVNPQEETPIEEYVSEERTITIHFIDETGKDEKGQYINPVDPSSTEYYEDENINKDARELVKPIIISGFEDGEEFNLEKYAKDTLQQLTKRHYICINGDNALRGIFILDSEENNMDVGLYFEYEPYTVTLNFLEKGTNKLLADSEIYTYKGGESFNFKETNPQEIKGYEFVEMTGELVGTIEGTPEERVSDEIVQQRSKVINIYYKPIDQAQKYKVVFNYYEELTGKKIAKSTEDIILDNEDYDFTKTDPPEIKGYEYTSMNGDVKGKVSGKNLTVNLYYKKVKEISGKYRVIINYLEKGTNKVLAPQFRSIKVDNNFKYNVKCREIIKIPNYKYVKTVGNVKGVIKDKDVVINVYYLKDGEEAVKTGDDNNLILWIGIGALAIVVIFILNKKSSKK